MIGFGQIEADYRKKVEADVARLAQSIYDAQVAEGGETDFLDAAFEKKLDRSVSRIASRSRDAARRFDKQPPTNSGRYSSFYASVLCNASQAVVVLRFSHTNRRHAFSPDGWSMMQVATFAHVEHWDLDAKHCTKRLEAVPA